MCRGGGKGPLISPERSLTLSCNNDQVVFVNKPIALGKTAGCLSPGAHPGGLNGQDAYTNQLIPIMLENHPNDSRVKIDESGNSQTLTSRMGTGGGNVPMLMEPIAFNGRQDPVSGRVTGALDTDGGTQCIAYAVRTAQTSSNGWGVTEELSYTLDSASGQAVCQAYPEPANTLLAKSNMSYRMDVDNVVLAVDVRNLRETEQSGTLQAKATGGYSLNYQNPVRIGYRVRRLTPLEYERLQGFPDGWTIGGSDSARYKAIGNSIALPCFTWLMGQIEKALHELKGDKDMGLLDYSQFIQSKRAVMPSSGFAVDRGTIHSSLFEFQKDIVRWALRRGRAAIFAGTGLGKTRMQIEWAINVHNQTGGDILLIAPLAVAAQTIREGEKLGYNITMCRSQDDVSPGLNITNYEMLRHFEPILFDGVVLDESSILKSFTGKIRTELIDSFAFTPYKLACTATPAPNDYMEIGNHAEFLGVMSRSEMLSMYFVHDGGETQKWRLKGHAEDTFWEWVASWGVVLEKPSDLDYPDDGYILPPLTIIDQVIEVEGEPARTLSQRQKARRETVSERVAACAEIVNATDRPFLVWCDLNIESEMLTQAIPGAVQVKGSDKPAHKEKALLDFAAGKIRVLVTKPSIAGFGMNWQHCADMAFVGLSDSFEQVFQAIRRCYRFGQTQPVNVHMITSSREGASAENIKRKEADFLKMVAEMVKYTKGITSESIRSTEREVTEYAAKVPIKIPSWLRSEDIAC